MSHKHIKYNLENEVLLFSYSNEFLFEDMAFLLLSLPSPPKLKTVFPFFLLTFHIKLFIYWLVPSLFESFT